MCIALSKSAARHSGRWSAGVVLRAYHSHSAIVYRSGTHCSALMYMFAKQLTMQFCELNCLFDMYFTEARFEL
jgi:hypothetical protein